jgi:hypothetical protein
MDKYAIGIEEGIQTSEYGDVATKHPQIDPLFL